MTRWLRQVSDVGAAKTERSDGAMGMGHVGDPIGGEGVSPTQVAPLVMWAIRQACGRWERRSGSSWMFHGALKVQ